MPLLCITLLALLLLPHSLSQSHTPRRPLEEIKGDYNSVVQTELQNTEKSIKPLLSNCTDRKLKRTCTSDNTDIVNTLHNLTCKMVKLDLSYTAQLASSVVNSIKCPCPQIPTKDPNGKSKRRSPTRKRLCRANAILSAMIECYEMLNTISNTQDQTQVNCEANNPTYS